MNAVFVSSQTQTACGTQALARHLTALKKSMSKQSPSENRRAYTEPDDINHQASFNFLYTPPFF
jgi:hypothetical protein